MRRHRRDHLPIGSISTGTLREEDLVQAYIDALSDIKLSRTERNTVRNIEARLNAGIALEEWDLESLTDIMDSFVPPYCRFGAHEGDGADIGVWPDWDYIESDVKDGELRRGSWDEAPEKAEGFYLDVNERGNTALYKAKQERWVEVWSIV
jgi:hypothetical protein